MLSMHLSSAQFEGFVGRDELSDFPVAANITSERGDMTGMIYQNRGDDYRFSKIYLLGAGRRTPGSRTSSARRGIQALPGIDQHFPNDLHAAPPLNRAPTGDGERVNQFGASST